MRILFANDDGIFSPGLLALLKAFHTEKDELYVAAPDGERSGASHSFTIHVPLRAEKVTIPGAEWACAYAISGTPVDCVKLAYGNLFPKPDLLISGINLGPNRGTDIFYSGTVSAAMEGAFLGIPSVAVSSVGWNPQHFEAAVAGAKYAASLLQKVPGIRLLNVNAPDAPLGEIRGMRITAAGIQDYDARYEERFDTHNRAYYWIASGRRKAYEPGDDCDERWNDEGYITITPIVTNVTDYGAIEQLKAAAVQPEV